MRFGRISCFPALCRHHHKRSDRHWRKRYCMPFEHKRYIHKHFIYSRTHSLLKSSYGLGDFCSAKSNIKSNGNSKRSGKNPYLGCDLSETSCFIILGETVPRFTLVLSCLLYPMSMSSILLLRNEVCISLGQWEHGRIRQNGSSFSTLYHRPNRQKL